MANWWACTKFSATELVNIPRIVCRYMLDWLSLLIMRSVDLSWNEFLASPGRSEARPADLWAIIATEIWCV